MQCRTDSEVFYYGNVNKELGMGMGARVANNISRAVENSKTEQKRRGTRREKFFLSTETKSLDRLVVPVFLVCSCGRFSNYSFTPVSFLRFLNSHTSPTCCGFLLYLLFFFFISFIFSLHRGHDFSTCSLFVFFFACFTGKVSILRMVRKTGI